jgi:hypothetical protein
MQPVFGSDAALRFTRHSTARPSQAPLEWEGDFALVDEDRGSEARFWELILKIAIRIQLVWVRGFPVSQSEGSEAAIYCNWISSLGSSPSFAPLQRLFSAITIDSQLSKPYSCRSVSNHLWSRMAKKSTTKSVPPQTLTGFINAFEQYTLRPNYSLNCYRGQRDASWPIVAGIFRPDLKGLLKNEKKAVREMISVHPNEFASDETMFDKLVRMQHFGLPTRLLDVSRNALVALYFATDPGPHRSKPSDGMVTAFGIPEEFEKYFDSDSVSCIANLANMTSEEKDEIYRLKELLIELPLDEQITKFNNDGVIKRLHQFIRSEKSYFQEIIDPIDLVKPYYVHPKMSNRRILAQSGAFILYGLDPFKKLFFPYKIEETSFLVPQKAKEPIRKALANLGINESTLFPEIDKAAARIKNQY